MDRIETDCVVIGAGVIGLSIARKLSSLDREVVILEAEREIGTGISARNSEVIHAGIYYPTGSLKAELCVAGRTMLYDFCASHGVEHRRLGKLIVATHESQLPALNRLHEQAKANGVLDLVALSPEQVRTIEPELRCVAALRSPSTGIIDAHGYMLSLLGEAESAGAALALNAVVESGRVLGDGRTELLVSGGARVQVVATHLVNAAGLNASKVARSIEGMPVEATPPTLYAKGNYFSLSGHAPFRHLVYPMPEQAGLGVHLTLDLGGQARFGPDVEWIAEPDYAVDPGRAAVFYEAIRSYWPGLKEGSLQPAYAGVRPKISARGQPAADFRIDGPERHGLAGHVHLFGIESPGLTSSLAIADRVVEKLLGD